MKNTKFLGFAAIVAAIVFTVSACASMTLVSIDNDSVTGPAQVRQFGAINPNDITIYGFYKDDSRKRVTISQSSITFDGSRVGAQTVSVRTSAGTVSFQTDVKALTGITVVSPPAAIGLGSTAGTFTNGLNIQGAWDAMGSDKIPNADCQFTGLNTSNAGRQTVTVAYQGKQTTFSVTVYDIDSIRITSNPTKTSYTQGEALSLAGINVATVYPSASGLANGSAGNITTAMITGYNPNTIGRQTVTVTYRGKTATFAVEVRESPYDPALNGTWVVNTGTAGMTFRNGTFDTFATGPTNIIVRGTYTTSGGKLNMTTTHLLGMFMNAQIVATGSDFRLDNAGLYSRDDIVSNAGIPQEAKELILRDWFSPTALLRTFTYSISGNTLTTSADGASSVYTKR